MHTHWAIAQGKRAAYLHTRIFPSGSLPSGLPCLLASSSAFLPTLNDLNFVRMETGLQGMSVIWSLPISHAGKKQGQNSYSELWATPRKKSSLVKQTPTATGYCLPLSFLFSPLSACSISLSCLLSGSFSLHLHLHRPPNLLFSLYGNSLSGKKKSSSGWPRGASWS